MTKSRSKTAPQRAAAPIASFPDTPGESGSASTPTGRVVTDPSAVCDELGLAFDVVNGAARNWEPLFFSSHVQVLVVGNGATSASSGGRSSSGGGVGRVSNRSKRMRPRDLVVTDRALYLFRQRRSGVLDRRLLLPLVDEIVVAVDSNALLLKVACQEHVLVSCHSPESRQRLLHSVYAFVTVHGLRDGNNSPGKRSNEPSSIKGKGKSRAKSGQLPIVHTTAADMEADATAWRQLEGCPGCARPVVRRRGAYVNSTAGEGLSIHADCFRCVACDVPVLDGQTFAPVAQGLPMCQRHALAQKTSTTGTTLGRLGGSKRAANKTCEVRGGPDIENTFLLSGLGLAVCKPLESDVTASAGKQSRLISSQKKDGVSEWGSLIDPRMNGTARMEKGSDASDISL